MSSMRSPISWENAASADAELPQQVRQLLVLVLVMIPAADFGERRFHADVGLDQPRDLLQAAAQFAALRVLRAV